jgi:dipeptidyl aminopeptidase/acylaminoacyl peptidase
MRCILCIVAAAGAFAGGSQETAHAEPANLVSIQDLATLRDIEGLSVSPDGRWAAFQVRRADPQANRYSLEWFVVPTAGGAARRLGDGGEAILARLSGYIAGLAPAAPPIWSPDSRWVFYLRQDNGRTQIWRTRVDGRRTEQLTHNEGDVARAVYARDGQRVLFETRPSGAQRDAALAAEGRSGFLYDDRFTPLHSRHPLTPSGLATAVRPAARLAVTTQESKVWIYTFEGERETLANAGDQAEFAQLTAASRPSGEMLFGRPSASSDAGASARTEARDRERQGFMPPLTIVVQPSGSGEVVCAAPECTGQMIGPLWWRGETEVVFQRREGAAFEDTALYAWRPGQNTPRSILRTPNRLDSCAVAVGKRLVCFYEQPDYPRRVAAVDLDTGAIDILYDPNPDFVRFYLGPPPRRLDVRTRSGTETYGYLVLPPHHDSARPLPLVIVTYRCSGFLRGGSGDEYPIYPFAAQGFAVLCLNLPIPDYGRAAHTNWVEYIGQDYGPGVPAKRRVQESVDAAIDQLEAMNAIDPNRVGLSGWSNGAITVLYALSHMPRLHAAIASSTYDEPIDYYLGGPNGRMQYAWRGWGPLATTAERWREFALSLNADRVRAPLLLNVADHEMLSTLMPVSALEDAGRAVEMYVFPDEYHEKWQPAHRLEIYKRNIDWMNFWLRGVEDSDPAKAAQYQRWRAMRERPVAQ